MNNDIDVNTILDPKSSVQDWFREWGKLLRVRGTESRWSKTIGGFKVSYRRRSGNMLMGRFGGGWNWKVGVAVGGSTISLDLLFFSLTVMRVKGVSK